MVMDVNVMNAFHASVKYLGDNVKAVKCRCWKYRRQQVMHGARMYWRVTPVNASLTDCLNLTR